MNQSNQTRLTLCGNEKKFCASVYLANTSISVHCASVLLNVTHLALLCTAPGLKKKRSYRCLLINICSADIATSIVYGFQISCELRKMLYLQDNLAAIRALEFASEVVAQGRLLILALVSVERYYAICTPFNFESRCLIKHTGKSCSLAWMFTVIIPTIRFILFPTTVCLHPILGAFLNGPIDLVGCLYFLCLTLMSIITITLLVMVWRNLSKRRQHRESKALANASRFVIINELLFLLMLLPCIIYTSLFLLNIWTSDALAWLIVVGQAIYGIANLILYCCMDKSYAAYALSAFNCKITVSRVRPITVVESIA